MQQLKSQWLTSMRSLTLIQEFYKKFDTWRTEKKLGEFKNGVAKRFQRKWRKYIARKSSEYPERLFSFGRL